MKHGTVTGYTTHKCHCELCTAAWRDYARQWARDSRAGRQRLTDAAETRRHLLRLIARGHTAHSVESMTGISDQAILLILRHKTKRVRHDTADRVLSVTLDDLPGQRSLAMLGYRPSSSIPTARNPRILGRNHRRVCVLYELLARQGRVPADLLEEVGT